MAAPARIELRQVGERVCRSLAGDERIDSERRLFAIVRLLDDLDVETLRGGGDAGGGGGGTKQLPPGFSKVSLLLERAAAAFDAFLRELPAAPDEYA